MTFTSPAAQLNVDKPRLDTCGMRPKLEKNGLRYLASAAELKGK